MASKYLTTAEELASLGVGDAVLFTEDGHTLALHVISVSPAGSLGRSHSAGPAVTVGYGIGRWSRTIDLETIRGGFAKIEKG